MLADKREAERIELFDRQRARLFENLVEHGGWKLYIELLNQKLEEMGATLLSQKLESVDDLVKLGAIKGPMYGLTLARDIVPLTIASMRDQKPTRTTEEAQDD